MNMSEESREILKAIGRNFFTMGGGHRIELHVKAFDPYGNPIASIVKESDLATKQFAQLIQTNILGTNQTITNTSGVGVAISANTALTNPLIVAGSGINPPLTPSVTDFNLAGGVNLAGNTPAQISSGQTAATIGAWGNTVPSSGVFQVTGTITNIQSSNQAYSEVGIQVNAGFNPFLITHDNFSGVIVSPNGTLQVTYNIIDS